MSSEAADLIKLDAQGMLQEIGTTGLDISAGMVHEEFLQGLKFTLARAVYKEMDRNDAVVGAMMYAIEQLIRPVSWTVEPYSDDSTDQANAEFLEGVFEDMSHSWDDFISEWMAAPVYGFAPFEIVWKKRNGYAAQPGLSSQFSDGKVGIRKLAIRHPDTLDRWIFDEEGGLQGMIQRAPPKYKRVEIPIEKLLLFTVLRRKGNPEGMSLLRRAYVAWYRKKRIEEAEAIGIERELAGMPVFTAPYAWFSTSASGAEKELLSALKRIARRVRTDQEQSLVIPAIYDGAGNKVLTFELVTTGGRRAIETGPAKEYYSRQMAMSILADVILLGHEKVGSFALASSKTNLFAAGLNAMLDGIEGVMNRHLIPRLFTMNGMTAANLPKLRHGDIETPDLDVLGEYVSRLAGAGFPLFPTEDGELERVLMRAANLPETVAEAAPMQFEEAAMRREEAAERAQQMAELPDDEEGEEEDADSDS